MLMSRLRRLSSSSNIRLCDLMAVGQELNNFTSSDAIQFERTLSLMPVEHDLRLPHRGF